MFETTPNEQFQLVVTLVYDAPTERIICTLDRPVFTADDWSLLGAMLNHKGLDNSRDMRVDSETSFSILPRTRLTFELMMRLTELVSRGRGLHPDKVQVVWKTTYAEPFIFTFAELSELFAESRRVFDHTDIPEEKVKFFGMIPRSRPRPVDIQPLIQRLSDYEAHAGIPTTPSGKTIAPPWLFEMLGTLHNEASSRYLASLSAPLLVYPAHRGVQIGINVDTGAPMYFGFKGFGPDAVDSPVLKLAGNPLATRLDSCVPAAPSKSTFAIRVNVRDA